MTGTNIKEKLEMYAKREVRCCPHADTYSVPFTKRRMDVCVSEDLIEIRVTDWYHVTRENLDKGFGHIDTRLPYTYWYLPEAENRALRGLKETDKYVKENLRDFRIAFSYAHYIFENKFGKFFN